MLTGPIAILRDVAVGVSSADHTGRVTGSGAGRIDHCKEALQAALYALKFATEAGFQHIELDVDATNLREALISDKYDLSPNYSGRG